MGGLDPRLSKAVGAHASVVAALSLLHSLRTRGLRRRLLFAALGSAIPVLGEHLAVNVSKVLRHHARPQVGGVPVAVDHGWYNIGYGTFVLMENLLKAGGQRERSRASAPAAALTATSLDLLLDPAGLDLGLWQWSGDGRYAAEVEGPNGKRGVPLLNFAGWIGLITGDVLAYQGLDPGAGLAQARRGPALLAVQGVDAARRSCCCPTTCLRRHGRLSGVDPSTCCILHPLRRRCGRRSRTVHEGRGATTVAALGGTGRHPTATAWISSPPASCSPGRPAG